MKIHSFRVGFATNSSSSHSIVLIPAESIGKVQPIAANSYGMDNFGWDWFRLVDEEMKLRYLAAQFFASYWGDPDAHQQIVDRFNELIPGYAEEIAALKNDYDRPSVDHQSVIHMSSSFKPKMLEEMIAFITSPRVVVIGGNDNEYEPANVTPRGAQEMEIFSKLMTDNRSAVRAKQDGPFWSIFDMESGTKVRFSLTDADEASYVKAETPELVDLKITDYCSKGCNFCYQSSTTEGVHADFDKIVAMLDAFHALDVFEVAIGGGEPTEHPRFADILRAAHERGLKPNFTTLSGKWLKDKTILNAVKETVGGIGVSCTDAKGLKLVERVKKAVGHPLDFNVMAQHVIGSVPLSVTSDFLNAAIAARVHVLLLGYKEVGFGAAYTRHDTDKAATLNVIKAPLIKAKLEGHHYAGFSVDTAMLDQFPTLVEEIGSVKALASSPEGKFSCYVDAVEETMGPSSYVQKSDMTPLAEEFKKVFATY